MDDRFPPYFFVRTADRDALHQVAPASRVSETALLTFAGEPVLRVEVDLPGDVPPLRARLAGAGVECFEADVRFAYRFLIDHGVRGAFRVDGPFERRPGVGASTGIRASARRVRAKLRCTRSTSRRGSTGGRSTRSRQRATAAIGSGWCAPARTGRCRAWPRSWPGGSCRTSRHASRPSSATSARPIPTSSPAGTSATSTCRSSSASRDGRSSA